MRIVKRLHIFMLQTFLPLFAMTFFIVLFIVLMQFLWKFIDDLVGKGLELNVLAELFFYAAVSMVPMALPLAILLASLMTFGNLGERFELTAMKASGISLVRVMAPLIVLISGVAVGAFFFQNDVLPKAQVKMWTLLFSMKQKSPEVEIPEGVFYDQIPGYNLFVHERDMETGMLRDVMIYDISRGGDNSTILLSDSARLAFTKDMRYLYLHLYQGEQFENLRDQSQIDQNVPFRRESFLDKEILIPFDANFNRLDDNAMRQQYVGKNISELQHTIDSVRSRVDSVGDTYATNLKGERLGGVIPKAEGTPDAPVYVYQPVKMPTKPLDLDSLMAAVPEGEAKSIYNTALQSVSNKRANYEFRAMSMDEDKYAIRRHQIELMKKFTLSVACLIFFFIGAPLGAIIRKGGIGTPLVISVLLFLIYYIIDNTGYKMARDGHWPVWFGMWLSTFILAPLGIYVTIKAMNDSAVFDKDAYLNYFRKLIGTRESRVVNVKEVVINEMDPRVALRKIRMLKKMASRMARKMDKRVGYMDYFRHGIVSGRRLQRFSLRLDEDILYITDTTDRLLVNKLMDYPMLRNLWVYHPASKPWQQWMLAIFVPLGIPMYLIADKARKHLKADFDKITGVSEELETMLTK